MDTTTGDGIDSNGTLTISGGSTEVWTANTADNQPLDADGTISITGGTVSRSRWQCRNGYAVVC